MGGAPLRRPQLSSAHSAQDARRKGRFAGPGAPVHQLPHPAGPQAAQVGRGAGGRRAWPWWTRVGCRVLGRRHEPHPSLRREDLWVREGRILDPEKLFFEERLVADQQRDCGGCILAPGFIDVQINGAGQGRGWRPRAELRAGATACFL